MVIKGELTVLLKVALNQRKTMKEASFATKSLRKLILKKLLAFKTIWQTLKLVIAQ